jgi:threonine aldolase
MKNRLKDDHENAKLLAEGLSRIPGIDVNMERVQINMVFMDVSGTGISDDSIVNGMLDKGIKIQPSEDGLMRFVTNNDVSRENTFYTIKCMEEICKR